MNLKSQTCCFTGHRQISPAHYEHIKTRLREEITTLIKSGYKYFGCGGAIGFDALASQTILQLKTTYPHIKLILVLPCKNQDKYWSEQDKKTYEQIKNKADKIVYTSENYTHDCMHKRNRHLVNCSSVCIAYFNGKNGGTDYTVSYGKSKNIKIINIYHR